jgi:hypothetical protein
MNGRARVVIPILFVSLVLGAALIQPACLDSAPGGADQSVTLDLSSDSARPMDLANADTGEDLAGHDIAKPILDFASTDLAGLVNCLNRAVCDPTMQFCITYNDGSQATPGKTVIGSPACYAPDTPCADNGQNMDCGCIQNDGTLGNGCQGSCVDNGDGTYVCYAQ